MSDETNINRTFLDASKFKIDTKYFSPRDLSLFVESLETLTRLSREKEELKEQAKLLKLNNLSKNFSNMPCSSSLSTMDTSAEASRRILKNKRKIQTPDGKKAEYDETYFSATDSAQNSPPNSGICTHQLFKRRRLCPRSSFPYTDSEDDSGVFPLGSSQQDIAETETKSKSKTTTTISRILSTRSRLIRKVTKRETKNVPSVELISHRSLDEYETLEMYKQEKPENLRKADSVHETEKYARFSTLRKKKARRGFASINDPTDEQFLNKALRYLTI